MQQNNSIFVRNIIGDNTIATCFQQTSLVALVFITPWCPACKMIRPILSDFAEKNKTIVFGFVNV
jgi:thiol-disulfide isomerase/thioredoxin